MFKFQTQTQYSVSFSTGLVDRKRVDDAGSVFPVAATAVFAAVTASAEEAELFMPLSLDLGVSLSPELSLS